MYSWIRTNPALRNGDIETCDMAISRGVNVQTSFITESDLKTKKLEVSTIDREADKLYVETQRQLTILKQMSERR